MIKQIEANELPDADFSRRVHHAGDPKSLKSLADGKFTSISKANAINWLALWLLASAALLWPAIINGGAFWFPDTASYIRGADAAFVTMTGSTSEWSDRIILRSNDYGFGTLNEDGRSSPLNASSGPYPADGKMVISGRSIYYGAFIYLPIRLCGPWAAIALQAVVVAAGLLLTLAVATRELAGNRLLWSFSTTAALIAFTPIGFYTCMLMPDIWSGIGVAMIALLAVKGSVMSKREMAFAWIMAAATAIFHSSHILLALGVGVACVALAPGRHAKVLGLAAGISVATLGLVGSAVFNMAVEAKLGQPPISPPFLSARLTDSGPGLAFLDDHCPQAMDQERFALCKVRQRLPQHSDDFLWSKLPESGVFQIASANVQRSIAAEDKKFYISVIMHDPLTYGQSFVQATLQTLTSFNMINFNYHLGRREGIANDYPSSIAEEAMQTKAFANIMPTDFTLWTTLTFSIIATAIILWGVYQVSKVGNRSGAKTLRLALILVAGLFANAVICGALSKPDARYQMRLQWLLPLAAVFVLVGRKTAPPQKLFLPVRDRTH